jgi:hypothetical protein
MGADCHTVNLQPQQTAREWDRPNPPVNGVRWCIRSNVNYQQSGVLIALDHVARHRETFLENHALKALRSVERGRTQAPYAFVIPRAQRHAAEAADLVNYFRRMGTEVHAASADFAARTMAPVIERPALPPAGAAGAGAAAAPTRADSARADSSGPNATGAALRRTRSRCARATGSCASTSRTPASPAPCSPASATGPTTRRPTTTRAGRSTPCATSPCTPSPTRPSSRGR